MKFWAASGKTENCKTNLPNFYSQLHCKAITDTVKTIKLTEVYVNAHVGMGNITFSYSQGNLAAWMGQKSKEQILLMLPAQFSVSELIFPNL